MHCGARQYQANKPIRELRNGINSTKTVVELGHRRLRLHMAGIGRHSFTAFYHALGLEASEDGEQLMLSLSVPSDTLQDTRGVAHEGAPLLIANSQMLMSLVHRPPCVPLRSAGEIAHDLRDQKLETTLLLRLMPPSNLHIGIEQGVGHPSLHELVRELRQAKDAPTTAIERAGIAVNPHPRCHEGSRCCVASGDGLLAKHLPGRSGLDVLHKH
mmetsp:Transcript_5417/g.12329  ORF Transcript_5417/g.12329 Transcript_5417/m.12329 type:complete len:214 (-) Transcript_5417:943-1584(-)